MHGETSQFINVEVHGTTTPSSLTELRLSTEESHKSVPPATTNTSSGANIGIEHPMAQVG